MSAWLGELGGHLALLLTDCWVSSTPPRACLSFLAHGLHSFSNCSFCRNSYLCLVSLWILAIAWDSPLFCSLFIIQTWLTCLNNKESSLSWDRVVVPLRGGGPAWGDHLIQLYTGKESSVLVELYAYAANRVTVVHCQRLVTSVIECGVAWKKQTFF